MSQPEAQRSPHTHVGHGVVATGGGDAQNFHVGVSLHGLKDVLQRGDGNVLQRQTQGQRSLSAAALAGVRACVRVCELEANFDLDVVEVDLRQAAVVAQDPLQRFLHVGAVRRLGGEGLEGVPFDHTCKRHNAVKKAKPPPDAAR